MQAVVRVQRHFNRGCGRGRGLGLHGGTRRAGREHERERCEQERRETAAARVMSKGVRHSDINFRWVWMLIRIPKPAMRVTIEVPP